MLDKRRKRINYQYLTSCIFCKKNFSRKNLQRHILAHIKEKPFFCGHGQKCFRGSDNLGIHVRTHNNRDKPYICPHCRHKFLQPGNLRRHLRIHTGEKPFKCNYCNKKFGHMGNRLKHERSMHKSLLSRKNT